MTPKEIYMYLVSDDIGDGILAAHGDDDAVKPFVFTTLQQAIDAKQQAVIIGNEHNIAIKLVRYDNRKCLETLLPDGYQ